MSAWLSLLSCLSLFPFSWFLFVFSLGAGGGCLSLFEVHLLCFLGHPFVLFRVHFLILGGHYWRQKRQLPLARSSVNLHQAKKTTFPFRLIHGEPNKSRVEESHFGELPFGHSDDHLTPGNMNSRRIYLPKTSLSISLVIYLSLLPKSQIASAGSGPYKMNPKLVLSPKGTVAP